MAKATDTRRTGQITVRVPHDLLALLDARYAPGISRTEAVLDILRDALGAAFRPRRAAPSASPPPVGTPHTGPMPAYTGPPPPIPGTHAALYRPLPPPGDEEADNPYTAYTGPES
jgi:hypothetical protein